ncbi:GGDEF domain-containing protein [Mycobacterium sp. AMU20-3851]|uniref:GGDEF domain-containing protein n=1 Tax=Mycobacterium sp. AMU20-3851 TaxID=3122055 RepID=UPI00375448A0
MPGVTSLAGADGRLLGRQHIRLLRIYLGATTFLYTYGVVFTVFPVRTDLAYGNPVGGMIAIVLGVLALIQLAVRPNHTAFATGVAIIATPIVMAFHVSITAEYVCLIAPMFLAMYLRAFHPTRRAWALIGILILACVAAVAVAPAPHVGFITFLIIVVAIVGAAESFGLLMRAMFTAACTDPLTGVLNRAGWEMATAQLIARFRSEPVPVTVIALDIDGLKSLNDTYGHLAGDRRITEYAQAWTRAVPRDAVVARLGGDEFAICVVHPRAATVDGLLDAIRTQTPGVSIGTATDPLVSADVAGLYARADAALYRGRGTPLRDELDPF